MKRIAWISLSCLFLLPATQAASFDCGKSSSKMEKLICSDPQLSRNDEVLAASYASALNEAFEPEGIRKQQREWLADVRKRCEDAACLKDAFTTRIAQLAPGTNGARHRAAGTAKPPTSGSVLNDTGITSEQCFRTQATQWGSIVSYDFCQSRAAHELSDTQDGMIGLDRAAPQSQDPGANNGFSFSRINGGCVKDLVTGLVWEVKGEDKGRKQEFTNLGRFQAGDVSELILQANQERWCGFSDWRLPTAGELQNLVDYSSAPPGPMIDRHWFTDTQARAYWSATAYVPDKYNPQLKNQIWVQFFSDGQSKPYAPYLSLPARLVRGSLYQPPQRFLVSADGQEVADNFTGLVWRRCVEGSTWKNETCITPLGHSYSLQQAFGTAGAEAARTGKPWRLPNIKELSSLIDYSKGPAFDEALFPSTPTMDYVWSSTPAIIDQSQGKSSLPQIWYVSFQNGIIVRYDVYKHSVRLVRPMHEQSDNKKGTTP